MLWNKKNALTFLALCSFIKWIVLGVWINVFQVSVLWMFDDARCMYIWVFQKLWLISEKSGLCVADKNMSDSWESKYVCNLKWMTKTQCSKWRFYDINTTLKCLCTYFRVIRLDFLKLYQIAKYKFQSTKNFVFSIFSCYLLVYIA